MALTRARAAHPASALREQQQPRSGRAVGGSRPFADECAGNTRGHENVTVEELPSMIRVDGTGQFDFPYDEIAEALGWADFGNDDFEEMMSTHYGRMVVEDDRVIMFANPRMRPSTSTSI